MSSYDNKREVLRASTSLRQANLSFDKHQVFISPDQALLQRDKDFKLRIALRKKKTEINNPNWMIKYRESVPQKQSPVEIIHEERNPNLDLPTTDQTTTSVPRSRPNYSDIMRQDRRSHRNEKSSTEQIPGTYIQRDGSLE